MGLVKNRHLKYQVFESFAMHGLPHGFFTRSGGVSPAPWDTLNLGGDNGDVRENIVENRLRLFSALNLKVKTLYDAWQVHSDKVLCVDQPRPLEQEQIKADALVTSNPNVTLFMRFADCVPICVYDPVKNVVGMIHAGWTGTVKGITAKTIRFMKSRYGCEAESLIAGIGPSICVWTITQLVRMFSLRSGTNSAKNRISLSSELTVEFTWICGKQTKFSFKMRVLAK